MPADIASEKPILVIDAGHAAAFAAELPQGALALFRAFPDYRMRVFPTHRSAAAPAAVYAAIRANNGRAHAVPEGIAYGVAGAAGGVPFPIPRNGTEIVWNHLLSFWGVARQDHVGTYIASGDGTIQQTAGYSETTDFPYYEAASPQEVGELLLQDAAGAGRAGLARGRGLYRLAAAECGGQPLYRLAVSAG